MCKSALLFLVIISMPNIRRLAVRQAETGGTKDVPASGPIPSPQRTCDKPACGESWAGLSSTKHAIQASLPDPVPPGSLEIRAAFIAS
jgi:hypothetical protein